MKSTERSTLLKQSAGILLMVVIVIGIALASTRFRSQIEQLGHYGYLGVFALSLIASSTIVLPAPFLPVVFSMGSALNPLGVGIAAALGSIAGESTGFFAGWSGQAIIEKNEQYQRISNWMRSNRNSALWAIFLLAISPLPLFDIAGIVAGGLRIPYWQFLLAGLSGKLIKMLLIAYAGHYSLDWLYRLFVPVSLD